MLFYTGVCQGASSHLVAAFPYLGMMLADMGVPQILDLQMSDIGYDVAPGYGLIPIIGRPLFVVPVGVTG